MFCPLIEQSISNKLAQLLESLTDNQQPELAGMPSNGSETDRTSRTEVAAMPKFHLENFCRLGYTYILPTKSA